MPPKPLNSHEPLTPLKPRASRIIMHLDMNSYFASVEQQANPFLRGKSVGVCAYDSPGGCILASSREAKAKGIKTGCKVSEAKRLDPNVVILENEPAKYRSTTEKIFKIFNRYTDTVEPYSIDEAFLDLTGWSKDFDAAVRLGRKIQKRIKKEVGEWLNCSIGISYTKFLAKFAGDIAPKAEILVINNDNLDHYLATHELQDAWGINWRMEARLKALGISNLLDLKQYDPNQISRALGRYGYYLWANVNGEEISRVNVGTPVPKSIGHSYCLPQKTTDKKYLSSVLYKLCERTGRRLRALDMEAQEMRIGWSYARRGAPTWSPVSVSYPESGEGGHMAPPLQMPDMPGGLFRSFKIPAKIFTTEEIAHYALKFLTESQLLAPVRMLAISVARLTPVTNQLSLFDNNLAIKELSRALDKLNNKYGEFTVIRGAMFGTNDLARDRIGFRKIV